LSNSSALPRSWIEFEEYTRALMEETHIPGAAVAVSHEGEPIYAKGFGVSDLATKKPVDPNTIFGIASVSKSFTALAIMGLQDKGLLSLDDPVIKYIPEWTISGVSDMSAIKIKHLLSHTTGVPPLRRREDLFRFDEHLEFFANEPIVPLGKPGEYLSYCNDTFLLLGAIIQRLTRKLFTRHMTVEILDKLDMNRSTYGLDDLRKFDNVTVPYVYSEKEGRLESVPWPQLGNYEVGGGVRSSVLDLMKYSQVYLNSGVYEGKTIVSAEAIQAMQQRVHQIGRNTYYCYALEVTPDYEGVTLVEHGGGQPGVSSNFGFVPEEKISVAVLTNVSDAPASRIWLAAVNSYLGLPIDRERSYEPQYETDLEDMLKFCGTYECDEGSKFTISKTDNGIKITIGGHDYDLRASSEDTLVFQRNKMDQVIKFYFDDSGKPWAGFFHLRMLRRTSK